MTREYENAALPDEPSGSQVRRSDVKVEGFVDSFRGGLDVGDDDVRAHVRRLCAQAVGAARSAVAVTERAVEHARAAHADAVAAFDSEAASPAEARAQGAVLAACMAILYLSTAAVIWLGDAILNRVTVSRVLDMPVYGPDWFHGVLFAVALTAVVIPVEAAFQPLFQPPEESGAPRGRARWRAIGRALALTGMSLLALAVFALAGEARFLFLAHETAMAILDVDMPTESFYEANAQLVRYFMILVQVALAAAAALLLVLGIGNGKTFGRIWAQNQRVRTREKRIATKRRSSERARASLDSAETGLTRTGVDLENVLEEREALAAELVASYRSGFVAGARAREELAETRFADDPMGAYLHWFSLEIEELSDGSTILRRRPAVQPSEPAPEPELPLPEQVRRRLAVI